MSGDQMRMEIKCPEIKCLEIKREWRSNVQRSNVRRSNENEDQMSGDQMSGDQMRMEIKCPRSNENRDQTRIGPSRSNVQDQMYRDQMSRDQMRTTPGAKKIVNIKHQFFMPVNHFQIGHYYFLKLIFIFGFLLVIII